MKEACLFPQITFSVQRVWLVCCDNTPYKINYSTCMYLLQKHNWQRHAQLHSRVSLEGGNTDGAQQLVRRLLAQMQREVADLRGLTVWQPTATRRHRGGWRN